MKTFVKYFVRFMLAIPAAAQAVAVFVLCFMAVDFNSLYGILAAFCFAVLVQYLSTYEQLVQEAFELLKEIAEDDYN